MSSSPGPAGKSGHVLARILSLEIARVTERAAVAAAQLRGRGNEKAADQAAVDAMRREMSNLPIAGTVVIGEGERDEAPMLFIGEKVGAGNGPEVDIAVDPLEGTTLCAKNMPGAIATMAMAEGGTLLNAPDVYMEKIAIGPGHRQEEGCVRSLKDVAQIEHADAGQRQRPRRLRSSARYAAHPSVFPSVPGMRLPDARCGKAIVAVPGMTFWPRWLTAAVVSCTT